MSAIEHIIWPRMGTNTTRVARQIFENSVAENCINLIYNEFKMSEAVGIATDQLASEDKNKTEASKANAIAENKVEAMPTIAEQFPNAKRVICSRSTFEMEECPHNEGWLRMKTGKDAKTDAERASVKDLRKKIKKNGPRSFSPNQSREVQSEQLAILGTGFNQQRGRLLSNRFTKGIQLGSGIS